jgi:hypothetical protein
MCPEKMAKTERAAGEAPTGDPIWTYVRSPSSTGLNDGIQVDADPRRPLSLTRKLAALGSGPTKPSPRLLASAVREWPLGTASASSLWEYVVAVSTRRRQPDVAAPT